MILLKAMYMMLRYWRYIPNITSLATNSTLNPNINEFKKEIPSITNLAKNTFLNAKINEVKHSYSEMVLDSILVDFFQSQVLIGVKMLLFLE